MDHLSKNADAIQTVMQLLFDKKKTAVVKISEDKTLALCTSLALSKWRYLTLRTVLLEETCAALPSYQKLLDAKNRFQRSCRMNRIILPLFRTVAFRGSFKYAAAKCWNNIPPPIRNVTSRSAFKFKLKLHLLELQKNA